VSTSTLTRLAPTQVELEIPITPEEMAAAEERAFRRLSKNVKLPGFRAGKVPRRVFEQTYGSASISSEALDEVVPEVYARAVREHELLPVDRPKMELLPAEEGRPSRLKATVEVRPAIDLGTYRGITVERDAEPITDEDVDRSIEALAKERATLVPVERAAALGDVVTMDYEGTIDGVAFEGGTAKGQMTELDEKRFIPGFATGIAGMSAGETKDVEAHFPADYPVAELAGKTPVFHVTVHDVKSLELPAIDDAFAQTISENTSLGDLRDDVRKRLEAISESRARRAAGRQIMDSLVASHEFPLPDVLVERELENTVNDIEGQATQDGGSFEDYLAQQGKSADELRAELRPEAEKRVKGTLLIEAIARAESINATPADVAEELSALARQYGQPVDRIRKALGNNVVSLMDGIVRNKTLEFLVDHAVLVEKT
jgi:trigger factor